MPTYDYLCERCGHTMEAFHAMSAKPLKCCPECRESSLVKLIGMGAAAIIRGTSTPCHGEQKQKKRRTPKIGSRLGEGKNNSGCPPWRTKNFEKLKTGKIKNLDKYINTGKVN